MILPPSNDPRSGRADPGLAGPPERPPGAATPGDPVDTGPIDTDDPDGTGATDDAGGEVEGDGEGGDGDERGGDHAEAHGTPSEEEAARTALAELAAVATAPRPPRRTGIFVDPEDLREHVGHLLRAILGGYEVDAFGNFTFGHEDARIFVTIGTSPIGPTVGVFSVTNLEIDLSPPLASFLLTTNHTLGFGSFSYDPANRSVWLRHTLLGTTLDGPELQSAVAAVATTAARLDDAIKERFGGRTFQEAPGDVQRRMEPPSTSQDPPAHPGGATGYL
jgi:hypothetical protein